ncbi:THO complex subunit 2 [Apiospora marii]|uniref:THO complex subunit 2 n=1 Tax=Apiospora marii TaxID=335849 RepID=A0ABR1SG63_9PEZI
MPPKRKRNEPASDTPRPSPHRPIDTSLAQHDRDGYDGGNRRRSGNTGGRNTRSRNAERRDSNASMNQATNNRGPITSPVARPTSSASQKAPQPVNIPPPATPTASMAPPPSPVMSSNYTYAVLTSPRLSAWKQSGRQEVIDHGIASRNDEDVEEIATISQEFARAVMENRLDPTEAGSCIKGILGPQPDTDDSQGMDFTFNAHDLFVDTISMFFDTEDEASKPRFRDFIIASEVSPELLRQALDVSVIDKLGLVRNTFARMGIRYATNILYRQNNYNLLREESEGFAKLITELYWTPHSLNQEQLTRAGVEAGFERIKGLIGTFDMDVGRVLDIVIDVFASTMMRTFRYFTMFLRVSSWWPSSQIENYDPVLTGGLPRWALPGASFQLTPDEQADMDYRRVQRDTAFWDRAREAHLDAFFELGGRRATDADIESFLNTAPSSRAKTEFELEWIKATKTLPPSGNQTAAQLFGFKLRFYTSQARDKDEIIPANLFYLAAYLIKVGFFSLPDLYPHLWPEDEKMEAVRERRAQELEEKEKKDRQGAEPNALLKAGALPDDTLPSLPTRSRDLQATKPEAESKEASAKAALEESLPEPKEVLKVDLVQHLLLIGAIPEALFLLGRFPWLTEAYPDEIISPINRILLYSIEKVYQDTRPRETTPITANSCKRELAVDQSGVSKGSVKLTEREPPKPLKWPHANGFNRGLPYEYYLKEWSDNVPVCHTVDDVFTLCGTLLNVSGVNIGRSPALLKKLTAIGSRSLHQDTSQTNLDRWQELLKRVIVPALNLANSNVDVVDAVWSLLKHYPSQVRYNIYAECYEGQISRVPAMTKAFKYARLDTLAILKRLSLQNISSSAKHLAKVALFSPGIVCKVALDQIEAYSNLIEAFVECAKYFTDLGHDVLVWSLMSSLGGKQRSRTQEGSVLLTSKWLQALSKFSGKVFRRYGNMNPTPLIQYVNDQLSRGNSTDLVILRELVTSMGGIVSDIDFTDAQLAALSGGEELRRQTFINLGDKRFESTKSGSRFMKALVQTELAPRLLTNMAQYRQSAIYHLSENDTHIKYIATLIDDSQQALVQYVELLRSNLQPEEFDTLVPSISELMTEYGLDADLAFLIGRVSLAHYLTGPGVGGFKGRSLSSSTPVESAADTEGDISMETKDESSSGLLAPQLSEDQMVIDGQDNKVPSVEGPSTPSAISQKPDHFLEVLNPIVQAVQAQMPSDLWSSVSPEFYVLFWALQTSDLSIPASSYNAETVRISRELDFIKKDRSDMTKLGQDKSRRRRDELTQIASKLTTEVNHVKERVGKTKVMLLKSAPAWISGGMDKSNAVADVLIEECIVPRMLLSPGDADFCHKMIRFLHDNQVSNFKITALYERFFSVNRLRSMLFSCSIREAEFLGRFIKLSLGDLAKWHKSKDAYEKEATRNGKHAGFAITVDEEGKPSSTMEHDHFRDQLWTWHRNLCAALRSCLQGTEWMHIRNAITILKAVLDYFPAVDFMGRQFMQLLQKIAEREAATKNNEDGQSHRVDLSVTANTAASALKKHESRWVMVQAFRSNVTGDTSEEKKAADTSKPASLRPSAPEFKPASAAGRSRTTAEDEDGEVKDHRPSSAASADAQRKDTENLPSSSHKPNTLPQKAELARPGRPSTPTARPSTQSPVPNRREPLKSSTLPSLPPGLPSRPDVPLPGHFRQDEYAQVRAVAESGHTREHRDTRERRDVRETREPREPREPRPSEATRGSRPPRESFSNDRRPTDGLPREASRSDRDRTTPRADGPPRWEPPSTHDRETRSSRDRAASATAGRTTDSARGPRDAQADPKSMPPPGQGGEVPGPTVNPERARLIGADAPDTLVNPARAALMADSRPGRPSREESRDRGSRHHSPSRKTERSETRSGEPTRDDRSSRAYRGDHQTPSRDDRAEPVPSTGHRADREIDRALPEKARDVGSVFQPTPTGARAESERLRASQQDPNYGRLNAIPSVTDMPTNTPDGPRGRGRNMTRPPPPQNQQQPGRGDGRYPNMDAPPRGASPERHMPPTGPASSRPRRGPQAAGPGNAPANSPSAPSGSGPGIHPDRLRQLGGPGAQPSSPQPAFPGSGVNSVGVHPDRMNRIGANQPPSGPSQHGRTLPPLQTPDRPSIPPSHGSHGGSRQPSGPMPITPGTDRSNGPSVPTGPSGSTDRAKGGSRRQLAGINNLLSGADPAAGRGGSLRGRSSRSNLAGSDAQVLTGASPVSTPVHERPESFPDRLEQPSSSRGGANGDERSSRGDRERSRRHHDQSERVPRSRDQSPSRDSRSKEHREYHEREPGSDVPGSGARDGGREFSRRSGRESSSNVRDSQFGGRPEVVGNGRGDGGGRESRHRGGDGGGSGRHDEHSRSGGGGRGGGGHGSGIGGTPRGEDHRSREPRGEDGGRSGRKRRSEEGGYSAPTPDSHKRQRQR